MKNIVVLAVFTLIALQAKAGVAHETDGVAGNSYLTFLSINQRFEIDIFTFGTDGTFIMERKDGTGTYEYDAPIFEAEWTSTDGAITYNFTGISLLSLVILGWENGTIDTTCWHCNNRGNFFFGTISELIPD